MLSAAEKLDPEIAQDIGKVVGVRGAHYDVRTAAGSFTARRAASCLRVPQLGDVVLLALCDGGGCYLLSVLEAASETTELSFDGNVEVRAGSGSLSLSARDAVLIATPGEVSLAGGRFDLNAIDASVVVHSLEYLGRAARFELERIKGVVGSIETIAERYLQIAKRSYRTVAGTDELRAKEIDYAAEELVTVRAKNTVVTAEQLLKVDAEQIHLG